MKLSAVLLLCVIAGCTTPAAERSATPENAMGAFRTPPLGSALRVGVEYLPPTDALPAGASPYEPSAPRVEATTSSPEFLPGDRGKPPLRDEATDLKPRDREEHMPWSIAPEELNAIRDPMERATLRLIQDLMGEDRRRIKRQLGTPILATRHLDLSAPQLPSALEEKQAEEEDEFMNEHGGRLLQRPLRNLLKNSMVVRSLEGVLEDFKADNVPLSDAYQTSHPGRTKLGRVSVRVHLSDSSDPLEMAYMNQGWRVGGSQRKLKAGYRTWLTDSLSMDIRSRYSLGEYSWGVRGDLSYYLDRNTSLHVVAGDNLEFLATSNLYSLFESPMDGSPGLLFYAVHLF